MAQKNGKTLENIRTKRAQKLTTEVADWGGVNAELVLQAIATLAREGGAIRFGYTRDGGAYAIGLYYGTERVTEYLRPSEDVETYFRALIEDFGG
jgi:hypothetical protein